jgi:hypothetical protein
MHLRGALSRQRANPTWCQTLVRHDPMFPQHTLPLLLWRLRRQFALYMLGAGASAPVVPMAGAVLKLPGRDFRDLGSFSDELAVETPLTAAVRAAHQPLYYDPDHDLEDEILQRLGHNGAFASLRYHLAANRFIKRRIVNYTVLRAFHPSLILSWNVDGLVADTCCPPHWVQEMHGSFAAGYGGPEGAEIMRLTQEWEIEIDPEGVLAWGREAHTNERLWHKLQAMQRSNPAFVMIVGYSFGKTNGTYHDQFSLDTFVRRFRGEPLDVYVLDPRPDDLADMLGERLQSNRVHAFPCWRGGSCVSWQASWMWPVSTTSMK